MFFVFLFVFLVAFLLHVEDDGDHTHPDKTYPEHHRGDDGHGRVFAKVLDEQIKTIECQGNKENAEDTDDDFLSFHRIDESRLE